MHTIDKLLQVGISRKASDLHLKVGYPPFYRVQGILSSADTEVLTSENIMAMIRAMLGEDARMAQLESGRNLDFSLSLFGHRFRANAAFAQGSPFLCIRFISSKIRELEEIGFPNDVYNDIIKLQKGLVLVTGVTGSGKSTTLASMIQAINRNRATHIITLEDPIEYVHAPIKSIISQRELGLDVSSFADGVKYSLREDPDVILVGEIRDIDTAKQVLAAANSGHLVFSTIHASSASETIRRFVTLFPSSEQEACANSLAANLTYVLSQSLIPYQKDVGRTLAMEILNVNGSVKNHIRKAEFHQIVSCMQMGAKSKMITMEKCLEDLLRKGRITQEIYEEYK
jgi:twitching motility protein PilT